MKKGQDGGGMPEEAESSGFEVVGATLSGQIEVVRYPAPEQPAAEA